MNILVNSELFVSWQCFLIQGENHIHITTFIDLVSFKIPYNISEIKSFIKECTTTITVKSFSVCGNDLVFIEDTPAIA